MTTSYTVLVLRQGIVAQASPPDAKWYILEYEKYYFESTMKSAVLIVDDEPLVLKTTALMLSKAGYEILAACDGKQALEICKKREEPIHLLLTDINMPDVNGYELAYCMVEKYPHTRVLFMTGANINTEAQGALLGKIEAANWSVLLKPFNREALTGAVEGTLSG